MFKTSKAFSSFSVNDLEAAKKFYTETLGLEITEDEWSLKLHTNGNNPIMVYPKDDHKPATHTVLNFPVEDIEAAIDELTGKGVKFEQYTGEMQTDEKGISEMDEGFKMAWFRDPAGNFISLIQEK